MLALTYTQDQLLSYQQGNDVMNSYQKRSVLTAVDKRKSKVIHQRMWIQVLGVNKVAAAGRENKTSFWTLWSNQRIQNQKRKILITLAIQSLEILEEPSQFFFSVKEIEYFKLSSSWPLEECIMERTFPSGFFFPQGRILYQLLQSILPYFSIIIKSLYYYTILRLDFYVLV